MSSTTSLEDNLAAADAAKNAYVIIIRDHVNSPYDTGIVREVIGPFFEKSDAQLEVNKMLGHEDESDLRRHNDTQAQRRNTYYWQGAQGYSNNNDFSFTISKTILIGETRWDGTNLPWTETEVPPYWGHEEA